MYCTAMRNLNFSILCILTTIASHLFISIISDSQSDSLVKPSGNSGPGHLTYIITNENNQPLPGVTVSIERKRKSPGITVNGNYVAVLPAGTCIAATGTTEFSSQRIPNQLSVNQMSRLIYNIPDLYMKQL